MGLVDNLRMNRIFPTGGMNLGWQGQLPRYGGSDPMEEIVNRFHIPPRQMPMPSGGGGNMRQIAQRNIQPEMEQPLRFGGVVGGDSNPGRDIMNRATANAERIYKSYSEPQVTAGELLHQAGIKPNEQDPGMRAASEGLDIDKQLDREGKRTNIDATKQRIQQGERRLSIAERKAQNPNLKFIPVKGGNIMAFDPESGESVDTGVATGTLSESERLKMQQDFSMKKQDDAQAAAANKPQSATQEGHAITNRINEAINRNPAWRQYINPETGMIAPIGEGASRWSGSKGLDEATRQQIIEAVYGDGAPNPAAPITPAPAALPPAAPAPTTNVVGRVQDVPAEKRQVGQTYTMGNGQPGVWTGRGFRPAQPQ